MNQSDYKKAYNEGWKDALEKIKPELSDERKKADQFSQMVLMLIQKQNDISDKYQQLIERC